MSLSLSIAPSNSCGPQANEAVGTNLTSGLRMPTHAGRQSYSQHGFLKYEPIQESGENIEIGGWTLHVQLVYKVEVCSQIKFTYFFFLFLNLCIYYLHSVSFLRFIHFLCVQCSAYTAGQKRKLKYITDGRELPYCFWELNS